jgi:hypothetical protein
MPSSQQFSNGLLISHPLHVSVARPSSGGSTHITEILRDVDRLASVSFHSLFFNHVWIASRLVRSFSEAKAGSLSVARPAVSSTKVAVADSGEVGRSAVYSRYRNGPSTVPWSAPD